jgi:hypothetical protein
MVIDVIDIERIAIGKSKNHAPIGPNGNRPEAFQLTLEGVQIEARQIHVCNTASRIETRDNIAQLLNMLGYHTAWIVVIPEALQSLVTNRPDHGGPVTCNVTHVRAIV